MGNVIMAKVNPSSLAITDLALELIPLSHFL